MNYEYRPPRGNYYAHLCTMMFFLLSGVCFAASGFLRELAVMWQSLGILLLLPAIRLVGKYMAAQYLYRVHTLEDGSVDLDVFLYRGGAKMQLVCRIGLDEITAALPLTRENRRAEKGIRRYSYCADLSPDRSLLLAVTNADGDCEVLLSYDETLATILSPSNIEP